MGNGIAGMVAESRLLQLVADRLHPRGPRPPEAGGAPAKAAFLPDQIIAAISRSLVLHRLVRTLVLKPARQSRRPAPGPSRDALAIPRTIQLPGLRCLGAGGGGPPR